MLPRAVRVRARRTAGAARTASMWIESPIRRCLESRDRSAPCADIGITCCATPLEVPGHCGEVPGSSFELPGAGFEVVASCPLCKGTKGMGVGHPRIAQVSGTRRQADRVEARSGELLERSFRRWPFGRKGFLPAPRLEVNGGSERVLGRRRSHQRASKGVAALPRDDRSAPPAGDHTRLSWPRSMGNGIDRQHEVTPSPRLSVGRGGRRPCVDVDMPTGQAAEAPGTGQRGAKRAHRAAIAAAIRGHPGAHFQQLKKLTRLKNGVLEYHLDRLVKDGEVASVWMLSRRTFFPAGHAHPRDRRIGDLRRELLEAIGTTPGITLASLSSIAGVPPKVVRYHVMALCDAGLVRRRTASGVSRFWRTRRRPRGLGNEQVDSPSRASFSWR